MSLQVAVTALAAAVAALTAHVAGGDAAPAASTGKAKSEPKAEPKAEAKPTIERDKVNAAVREVKEKFGADAAKALIKEAGKSDKLADVSADNLQALYDAATKKVAEAKEEI